MKVIKRHQEDCYDSKTEGYHTFKPVDIWDCFSFETGWED